MNDREFNAFLREALRSPAPSHVPDAVKSDEIARTLSAVFDDLVWTDDIDVADDERDDAGSQDAWDDIGDPLLSAEPVDGDDRHDHFGGDGDGDVYGLHDSGTDHGLFGHTNGDIHGSHDSGTDHGSFGHHGGPPDHGLDGS
ncbi:MAG: hypothetical protein M3P52_09290 [Actinomycetota bacterium]|nr:hypothetical protein [Actinomycetota bacterium]